MKKQKIKKQNKQRMRDSQRYERMDNLTGISPDTVNWTNPLFAVNHQPSKEN